MTSDALELPNAVVRTAQGQEKSPPRVCTEENTSMNQPQPSNLPGTPAPLPDGPNATLAPEPMTLPEKHQAALRHIHTLETHNAKLYDDNCRLVNTVNMLNERLGFLGTSQNAQVHRLADLQERLRMSEASRASIYRKYQDLLQSMPPGSAPPHIGLELQAVRDAYTSLDREYRLLGDKYVKLKALADAGRIAQQQSRAAAFVPHAPRDLVPAIRSEFHTRGQGQISPVSPASFTPSGSLQPLPDQRGDGRRRSSGSVIAQTSLRTGTSPVATTWLAPLPTPPPSTPLPGSQLSPKGFPVHTPVPARSLPLPHHVQVIHDPRLLSGPTAVTSFQHSVDKGASEQLEAAIDLRQHSSDVIDLSNNEPVPCNKQVSVLTSSEPSPPPQKRLQTTPSPGRERKKPRIEEEDNCPTTVNVDTCPASKIQSPITTDFHELSVSESDVRPYEDRVNLIFEKDANVGNGVFCGLCLDRYEAKMILEPPDVLIQPDFDFLVKHCMTMHPTVWDDLRHKS